MDLDQFDIEKHLLPLGMVMFLGQDRSAVSRRIISLHRKDYLTETVFSEKLIHGSTVSPLSIFPKLDTDIVQRVLGFQMYLKSKRLGSCHGIVVFDEDMPDTKAWTDESMKTLAFSGRCHGIFSVVCVGDIESIPPFVRESSHTVFFSAESDQAKLETIHREYFQTIFPDIQEFKVLMSRYTGEGKVLVLKGRYFKSPEDIKHHLFWLDMRDV